jgi:hypothetical protein
MSKLKKIILLVIGAIITILTVVILCISPITKYLIQKYDVKFTGREISMDWAYANPFTGYIHLSNLQIFEQSSDTVFFSAKGVSADFALLKMFYGTYEISELLLNSPNGNIIQNKSQLNFDDLIEKFSIDPDSDKEPVHFNILDIAVENGLLHYLDSETPVNYFIRNINIRSKGSRWNTDFIAASFSFSSGLGNGDMKGDFSMDKNSMDYQLKALANKYELDFIGQYIKDLTNYGSFSANLDADIKIAGNFNDRKNLTAAGFLGINDFHFGKNKEEDYASFDKLAISILELNPQTNIFYYDSIIIQSPFFKFERYDYLDNLQTMFGVEGSNIDATIANNAKFNLVIEIANYIKLISRNFLQSHYKVNKLAVYDGNFQFKDYSLSEKFSIDLNPLTIIADSIDTNKDRVDVSIKSGILPFGDFSGTLSINPKDSGEFDLHYVLQKLPLALFNPYTIAYTSFPLNRGTIEAHGDWRVRDGNIKSDNHVLISNLRTSTRLRNRNSNYLPVPLVMAFVRDADNMIDYEIPITGNLKNPKFRLRDVLMDLLKNIFVKPPTTPYRMKVKKVVSEIENALVMNWQMRQALLLPDQEKFIEKMVDFLSKNPDENIVVHPQWHSTREKEYILFFESKKKYFLSTNNKKANSFTEQDSLQVDKMSVKDPLFVNYLNQQINDSMLFTVHEKCSRLIGADFVNSKFDQLNKQRKEAFLAYFKQKEVDKQISFTAEKTIIPYNGFSLFKMEYQGGLPESLIKAYQQMNEINEKELHQK